MRKITILLCSLCFFLISQAQLSKSIKINNAGTLSTLLTRNELNSLTNLTITGEIDTRDFKTMRDSMPELTVIDLSKVTIVAYKGKDGTALYNENYPANEIPFNSFVIESGKGKTSLKTITLPNSATSIGPGAFMCCTGLTTFTIPGSIISIKTSAFMNCSGLTSINIPNSVTTVDDWAFTGTKLADIVIPVSVKRIGRNAFGSVWFKNQPDGLIYINKQLYKYKGIMPANTSITVLEGTTQIHGAAFDGCKELAFIRIPKSVKQIDFSAFRKCSGLSSVILPDSVSMIGDEAFSGCTGLTSITLPMSLNSLGHEAFARCTGLTSVSIPNTLKTIAARAFLGCKGLTSVIFSNSVMSVQESAFAGCTSLTSITIPSSVSTIGNWAFSNCTGLLSITLPKTLNSIKEEAFNHTAWLENKPDGLIYINKCAYLYKGSMPANTKIKIKDGTLQICGKAFSGCAELTSIILPNTITHIGSEAFINCKGLTSIEIPNSVTFISDGAFFGCSGLTAIKIPDLITFIAENAFSYCTGLKTIPIPDSVKTIGEQAFVNCTGLTSITIPKSVTRLYAHVILGCSGLTSIIVKAFTPPYASSFLTFDNLSSAIQIIVPKGTLAAYQKADGWKDFSNIIEEN